MVGLSKCQFLLNTPSLVAEGIVQKRGSSFQNGLELLNRIFKNQIISFLTKNNLPILWLVWILPIHRALRSCPRWLSAESIPRIVEQRAAAGAAMRFTWHGRLEPQKVRCNVGKAIGFTMINFTINGWYKPWEYTCFHCFTNNMFIPNKSKKTLQSMVVSERLNIGTLDPTFTPID